MAEQEDKGWFDVDAYKTRERWEGPDAADDGLDGFNTLEAAIEYANSAELADYYQVTVVALGEHVKYEPGERVYQRFDREYASPSEVKKPTSGASLGM